MASKKNRRKQAKRKRPPSPPGKPFVHPDGDRRWRGKGMTADQGVRDKRARQTFAGGLQGEEE